MKTYRVEVRADTDTTFEITGFESEEDVRKMIESNFDYFAGESSKIRILGERYVGYLEIQSIELVD